MNGQRIRKRWGPQTNGGRKKKAECLKKKRGNARYVIIRGKIKK